MGNVLPSTVTQRRALKRGRFMVMQWELVSDEDSARNSSKDEKCFQRSIVVITLLGPNLVKPKQTQFADSNKICLKDTHKSKPCWNLQANLANICCLSAVYRWDGIFMANQGKLSLQKCFFLHNLWKKKIQKRIKGTEHRHAQEGSINWVSWWLSLSSSSIHLGLEAFNFFCYSLSSLYSSCLPTSVEMLTLTTNS